MQSHVAFENDFFRLVETFYDDDPQGDLAILVKQPDDGWDFCPNPQMKVSVSALRQLKKTISSLKENAPMILRGHYTLAESTRLCSWLGLSLDSIGNAYLIPKALDSQTV
jgi:hypothetical protein